MPEVPIRYTDPNQVAEQLQWAAQEVAVILEANEEILYIALRATGDAASPRRDSVVLTTDRIVVIRPRKMGRITFSDMPWTDVKDVSLEQDVPGSEISVDLRSGHREWLDELDNDQALHLYTICREQEREWLERRCQMEEVERRAQDEAPGAGAGVQPAEPVSPSTPVEQPLSDPAARLGKLKIMLDQGLISQAEYDEVKARILADI